MNFLFNGNSDIRSMEDKSVRKLAEEKVKKRITMESKFSTKKSLLIMLGGVFFGVIFTGLEYVLKNFDLGVIINTVVKAGMFLSLAGSLLAVVGLYHFIKSFMR